jgi:hypothetical protein
MSTTTSQSDDENLPCCGIKEEIEENNVDTAEDHDDVGNSPASPTALQRTVTIVVNAQEPQQVPI